MPATAPRIDGGARPGRTGGADTAEVVLAYEPVWAIGTGKSADADEAERVHGALREMLDDLYGAGSGAGTRILYGGSVNPDNAGEYLAREQVDGVLVGGASLDSDTFLAIRSAG